MHTETKMVDAVRPERTRLLRVGGIAAMILGLSYILITVVYVLGGALPQGAEEWLRYLDGHRTAWWVILWLSVLTDFLFLPVAVALYVVLRDVNRETVLAGTGLVGMFAILDLVVTWPNYSALIMLSGNYAAAANDAQRALFVSAATYASAVLTSTVFAVYAILVPSVGILLIGLVMLEGPFNKATALSGVATGVLGIVAVVGPFFVGALGAAAVIASVLTTIWVLLVGVRLCQLD